MYCHKCGKSNLEDAVFCMQCGSKLNYIPVCDKCGKEIPEDAVFCPYCGAKRPDAEISAAESEICGTAVHPAYKPVRAFNSELVGKVLFNILNAHTIFLAVIVLIFVVFTGVSLSVPYGMDATEVFGYNSKTADFIYYFGDAYRDVEEAIKLMGSNSTDYFEANLYINVVLGTLVGVASIITCAVLSITAIVKGIKVYTSKGKGNGEYFAL